MFFNKKGFAVISLLWGNVIYFFYKKSSVMINMYSIPMIAWGLCMIVGVIPSTSKTIKTSPAMLKAHTKNIMVLNKNNCIKI